MLDGFAKLTVTGERRAWRLWARGQSWVAHLLPASEEIDLLRLVEFHFQFFVGRYTPDIVRLHLGGSVNVRTAGAVVTRGCELDRRACVVDLENLLHGAFAKAALAGNLCAAIVL